MIKRPLVIFYILVIYVLLSFLWWTYLMFDFNNTIFKLRKQVSKTHIEQSATRSHQLQKIRQEYNSNHWMIIGEGSVFFILLLCGGYFIHRSFKKEARLNQQQQNFLLAVTHELKSPLSSIKLGLQTLQQQTLTQNETKSIIEDGTEEIHRLENLVENILFTTRFEQKEQVTYFRTLSLSALVKYTIEDLRQSEDASIAIQSDIEFGMKMEGDETSLKVMVQNLLRNALHYSSASPIIVELFKEQGKAVLRVKDRGPGIPDKEKKKIFDRFYRVGTEQVRHSKGTGLGLYIVKQVVSMHRGEVQVKDREEEGSVFEVRLPMDKT